MREASGGVTEGVLCTEAFQQSVIKSGADNPTHIHTYIYIYIYIRDHETHDSVYFSSYIVLE